MDNTLYFNNEGITLTSCKLSPIIVNHFGGMKFVGDDVVDYEIVTQKESEISYAYLEISKDMKTGVLFDTEPMYNFYLGVYESNGLKLELKLEFHDGVSVEIPQTRLLMLRVKQKSSWLLDFLLFEF